MPLGRSSRASNAAAALLLLLAAVPGCTPTKTVRVTSEPSGARVTIARLNPDGSEGGRVPLEDARTPLTTKLKFPEGETYRVEARKEQFLPDTVDVTLAPKNRTDYAIKLTRYLSDLEQVTFAPEYADRYWVLTPGTENTTAYVLHTKESGPAGESLGQVTSNDSPDVDYRAIVHSPTADIIAYQRIERRPVAPRRHTVRKKETLRQIADANGLTVDELLAANAQYREKPPKAGDVVNVPQLEVATQIYKQSPGRPASRVTSDAADEHTPAFTSLGDNIVFASDSNSGNATLWRVRTEGGGAQRTTRVTRTDALDYAPSVGQDFLAYTSVPPRQDSAPRRQIWTARLDGGEASRLIDGENPQISPDDQRILYLTPHADSSTGKTVRRLWVMNADGSEQTALTNNSTYDVIDPVWSPDGRWIAFAANPPPDRSQNPDTLQNFNLYVMPIDGSAAPVQVTTNEAYDSSPAWDRTGTLLYFRSNRGGAWNIWRVGVADIIQPPAATERSR